MNRLKMCFKLGRRVFFPAPSCSVLPRCVVHGRGAVPTLFLSPLQFVMFSSEAIDVGGKEKGGGKTKLRSDNNNERTKQQQQQLFLRGVPTPRGRRHRPLARGSISSYVSHLPLRRCCCCCCCCHRSCRAPRTKNHRRFSSAFTSVRSKNSKACTETIS